MENTKPSLTDYEVLQTLGTGNYLNNEKVPSVE
jgi:hypothetical protein